MILNFSKVSSNFEYFLVLDIIVYAIWIIVLCIAGTSVDNTYYNEDNLNRGSRTINLIITRFQIQLPRGATTYWPFCFELINYEQFNSLSARVKKRCSHKAHIQAERANFPVHVTIQINIQIYPIQKNTDVNINNNYDLRCKNLL